MGHCRPVSSGSRASPVASDRASTGAYARSAASSVGPPRARWLIAMACSWATDAWGRTNSCWQAWR
eukprot:2260161-Alexandrium_andersonii.AAC.1